MFDLTEIILESPFSGWVTFLSVFVFTVGAFSFATKQYEKERNKRAIERIFGLCRLAGQKFVEANRDEEQEPSIKAQKVAMWFGVFVLCMLSAWMYLYAFAITGLMVTSGEAGLNLTLIILLAVALVIIANMYRISARKMRREIASLR